MPRWMIGGFKMLGICFGILAACAALAAIGFWFWGPIGIFLWPFVLLFGAAFYAGMVLYD